MIPIIVEPLTFEALGDTPLLAKQAFKIGSLESVADEIKRIDGYDSFSISLFNEHAKKFKSKINRLIQRLPKPKHASVKEHEEAKKEIKKLIEKNMKQRETLEKHQEYIEQLEGLKDNVEVGELKISKMDEWEQLMHLIEQTKDTLSPLSDLLVTILYYDIRGEDYRPNNESDYNIWKEVEELKNEDKVIIDEDEFTVTANTDYPDIEEAKEILVQLSDFISWASIAEPELVKLYKEKYKMPLSINSNLFNKLLKKRIYSSK